MVCVTPAAGTSAVTIASIAGGKVTGRELVQADAQDHAVSRDGCTGTESAQWSTEGTRVYLRSQFACSGSTARSSSTLMAMLADGNWINVQGVSSGGNRGVRVVQYRAVTDLRGVPADIKAELPSGALAAETARIAAGAPVSVPDVIDASHHVDASVVQAWLAARQQRLDVDAQQLEQLADAKVPDNVIDLMVALSYPKVFAVNPPAGAGVGEFTPGGGGGGEGYASLRGVEGISTNAAQQAPAGCSPYSYSPYGFSPWGMYDPCAFYLWNTYGMYSPYMYSPYGYYNGLGYGYGYGYGGWYGGGQPVVIVVKGTQEAPPPHGRVVKGQGYTQPRATGAASGETAPSGSSSGASSPPPSSGGTGRVAVPRKPGGGR
jgi:hypothetical protein